MSKLSGGVVGFSRVSVGCLTGRRIPSVSMSVFPEYAMEISELMGWSEISVARESDGTVYQRGKGCMGMKRRMGYDLLITYFWALVLFRHNVMNVSLSSSRVLDSR